MDTQKVTQNYRLKKWTRLISECRSSGQTVSAWCAEHNIHPSSYFYWLRRVRTAACEALPALQNENNSIVPVSFSLPQVSSPATDSLSPAIVVRLDSASLEIHNTASLNLIENTLRALQHVR
ncbi:hypothetical protein Desdi_2880 [Desulfitobacterium dichloroeliminans LMG P-21439]|uniref:Transposase n=1 Tax=Desulfitobacterium dichloroeliminans (strain LMG P-21439 / DCA1) TaxID=871963 RepID=L0F316_DESDL|nr:hypothetical protein [Desulfitobacterium dichloroeliminans]AGA68244.1 hypothetical protein Desdi_0717 [Desulfitobacterium dichloroeliminans LMG P-21439]AGA69061.1 hypothetical protein Desdi_1568 [Desulfitobacterium dichloroeliminans LMG P-21439]AGA69296.1 hypothetical protein Desdi_1847 [Desulfitobacterium dichloroeliminans LMG P-21439]AGA70245.1 hypothetical protein Desdi_2833 [Desulfitobacterium dichloroeliminans LMG P-21439]AGA70292.1 hypothetical protein Desdi_2880 [Desulfitobacterium d